jgi:arsenate reductase (thioredoxin)
VWCRCPRARAAPWLPSGRRCAESNAHHGRDKPAGEPQIHIELSIDQRQALKSAAARLHTEFADTFTPELIERLVYSSYDQFADPATVHDFLALLAERFTRQ